MQWQSGKFGEMHYLAGSKAINFVGSTGCRVCKCGENIANSQKVHLALLISHLIFTLRNEELCVQCILTTPMHFMIRHTDSSGFIDLCTRATTIHCTLIVRYILLDLIMCIARTIITHLMERRVLVLCVRLYLCLCVQCTTNTHRSTAHFSLVSC